jgi:hypothetical protein
LIVIRVRASGYQAIYQNQNNEVLRMSKRFFAMNDLYASATSQRGQTMPLKTDEANPEHMVKSPSFRLNSDFAKLVFALRAKARTKRNRDGIPPVNAGDELES